MKDSRKCDVYGCSDYAVTGAVMVSNNGQNKKTCFLCEEHGNKLTKCCVDGCAGRSVVIVEINADGRYGMNVCNNCFPCVYDTPFAPTNCLRLKKEIDLRNM